MRLFVAINFTKTDQRRIHSATKALRAKPFPFRWLDLETFHLTLKFLGSVDQERVPELADRLDKVAAGNKEFMLDWGGFGAFPTVRKPRTLWVGVDPSPALRCLKQDLEWGLNELGYARETRAFQPHVTVARADDEGAGAFRGFDEMVTFDKAPAPFRVRSLDLMRSLTSKGSVRYETRHKSSLASLD